MLPDYISDELSHLPESSKKEAEKLAKELNIETENLKNQIIQIFNKNINKLKDSEISFYYSVYLYLVNKEKKELTKNKTKKEKEKSSKILIKIKKYYKTEYDENDLKQLLNYLNIDELANIIEYMYYFKKIHISNLDGEYNKFKILIEKINKDIILNIILDKFKSKNNKNFDKLFYKTQSTTGKNQLIKFLESIDYETYIKFKSLIFLKNNVRTTQFYIILKKYINYTETDNFKKNYKGDLKEDFKKYYEIVKNSYKGKFTTKQYHTKYYNPKK